jgi:YceI-like domain
MALPPGEYRLGPEDVTLAVRTARGGAAAKAGHDLLLHVTSWSATLMLSEDPANSSLELEADATSLRVIEGTGGAFELGEDDVANIQQTIDDEVLVTQGIEFRSTGVREEGDGRLGVEGELTIVGTTKPIAFELEIGDGGALSGAATVTQTDWGMKPYSTLFGALKVADEVEVAAEGHLPPQSR